MSVSWEGDVVSDGVSGAPRGARRERGFRAAGRSSRRGGRLGHHHQSRTGGAQHRTTRGDGRLRGKRLSDGRSGPLGVLDELGREDQRPDVVGFPAPGPVRDESFGRHQAGLVVADEGALGITVEAEGDGGQAEGVGEGLGEVPDGAGAALVMSALKASFAAPPYPEASTGRVSP